MKAVVSLLLVPFLVSNAGFLQQNAAPAPTPPSQQNAAPAPTPAPAPTTPKAVATAVPDKNGNYMLREGEDVNLQFAENLSSKTASEGDTVALTLVDDIKVGDVVVAKGGAHAVGEVTRASKAGMMGKAGDLAIHLNYLKVGDNKIRLRGNRGKEGESGTTSTIVLTVLLGPIGLIKHGKDVEIKSGQALHAFVSDDIALPPVPTN